MEQLSIKSYIAHGHEYHLYVYGEVDNVPAKTVLKDANEILPSSSIFQYREYKSYAGFSNFFRYKLVLEKGGWWSDLDVICVKSLDFDAEYVFSSEENDRGIEGVTSGIFKAPKGAELLSEAWSICRSKDTQKLKWGETGPLLMQELVRTRCLNKYVKGAITFCPIPPHRFYESLLPGRWMEWGEQTYTIHLWNECWRRLKINKDEEYAPRCLYERLKCAYLSDRA
jgi:hypothetical protein